MKRRAKLTEEAVALLRSYEAKTSDIQPVAQKLRVEVEAAQEQVIRDRFALRGKLSREEWAMVFPPR